MEEATKKVKSKSHKEFEKLLSKDWANRKFSEGEITIGVVSEVSKNFVFIDLGLKSESAIPIEEFRLTKELDKIKKGSKTTLLVAPTFKFDSTESVQRLQVVNWRLFEAFCPKVRAILDKKCTKTTMLLASRFKFDSE